jgi:hypothetical protein
MNEEDPKPGAAARHSGRRSACDGVRKPSLCSLHPHLQKAGAHFKDGLSAPLRPCRLSLLESFEISNPKRRNA